MIGIKPQNIDLKRYLGKWYEIDSFPAWFQRGCLESTAFYSQEKSGKIGVKNTCKQKNGTKKIATGSAVITEKPNILKVQFFPLIKADYIIEFLDMDYKYVIVGSTGKNYLWILSRVKNPDKEIVKELVSIVERKGYDINKLKKYGK
jgi:apolipoprotein D and lipocalin family protein